jgi:hypothetical protein
MEIQICRTLALLQIPFFEKGIRIAMCGPFHDDRDPSAAFYLDTRVSWLASMGERRPLPLCFPAAFYQAWMPAFLLADR